MNVVTESVLTFFFSAATVVLAGVFLTKFASRFSEVTGLGGLFVGSVFLAGATSIPELMVDMSAVEQRNPNIAIGALFGSSLFNLLILGLCDLLHRSRGRLLSKVSMVHALTATQSTALTAIAGVGILIAQKIEVYAIGSIGLSSIFLIVAYLLGMRVQLNNEKFEIAQASSGKGPRAKNHGRLVIKNAFGYLVSAAMIFIAAPFVAEAAAQIADYSGLGDSFIGTTLVAFATSLPELVASFTAVRLGAYDMVIGNIFGSNSFNMILIAPLDFISDKPILSHASSDHLFTAFGAIAITSVAVIGQLYRVEKRKLLLEPDATLVIIFVAAVLAGSYYLS